MPCRMSVSDSEEHGHHGLSHTSFLSIFTDNPHPCKKKQTPFEYSYTSLPLLSSQRLLVKPLLSAFLAFLAAAFLQAKNLLPGLKGVTLMPALSAALPISQLAARYWYPGLRVGVALTTSPVILSLTTTLPLFSLGASRMVDG